MLQTSHGCAQPSSAKKSTVMPHSQGVPLDSRQLLVGTFLQTPSPQRIPGPTALPGGTHPESLQGAGSAGWPRWWCGARGRRWRSRSLPRECSCSEWISPRSSASKRVLSASDRWGGLKLGLERSLLTPHGHVPTTNDQDGDSGALSSLQLRAA